MNFILLADIRCWMMRLLFCWCCCCCYCCFFSHQFFFFQFNLSQTCRLRFGQRIRFVCFLILFYLLFPFICIYYCVLVYTWKLSRISWWYFIETPQSANGTTTTTIIIIHNRNEAKGVNIDEEQHKWMKEWMNEQQTANSTFFVFLFFFCFCWNRCCIANRSYLWITNNSLLNVSIASTIQLLHHIPILCAQHNRVFHKFVLKK